MSRLLHHQLGDERYPFSLPDNPQPRPKLHQTQPLPPKGQTRANAVQIRNRLCQIDQAEVMRYRHQTGIPESQAGESCSNRLRPHMNIALAQGRP